MHKKQRNVSWQEVEDMSARLGTSWKTHHPKEVAVNIYGVPRGGICPALLVHAFFERSGLVRSALVNDPKHATLFIDDLVDSGATKQRHKIEYPNADFYALFHKKTLKENDWIIFPWEAVQNETTPTENVKRLIEYIGDNPEREGLLETPDRVIRSFKTLYGGYNIDPKNVIKCFKEEDCKEMVVLRDIEFHSTCEHHMLPFSGKAHIGYLPDKKVVGVSKLARLLDIFARRLQIQERIGEQVTECLMKELSPLGAACILEAQHFCMTSRGVEKQNSVMVTSSLRGMLTEEKARNEFLRLIGK